MLRVGLTGGLASGKTFVAGILEELGCTVIHADDIGHEVLAPDGEAFEPVLAHFGRELLTADGVIDRARLASLVFADPEKLALLNSLVHPAVFRREEELMLAAGEARPGGIVVVEAAILIETGSYKRYRKLIVAVCSEEQQIERAMRRDGYTLEGVRARLARQIPLPDKRRYADYVIDTSGSKESTVEQTRRVYEQLRSIEQ